MGDRATGLGGNSDLKVSPELAEMDLGIGNMVSMPRREDKIVLGPDNAVLPAAWHGTYLTGGDCQSLLEEPWEPGLEG